MIINGVDYTLLRDYDKGKYHALDFGGKVTYLRARVELILINPCKAATSVAAIQNAGMGLILATGICAMVSAASTYHSGGRSGQDRAAFLAFVNKYMPQLKTKIVASPSITWAEWLYDDVRCGLAHGFTIKRGGIEDEQAYLRETTHGPEISLSLLLEDFAQGWARYLADVECAGPTKALGILFDRQFKHVFRD
jgi:hypothetical protein